VIVIGAVAADGFLSAATRELGSRVEPAE